MCALSHGVAGWGMHSFALARDPIKIVGEGSWLGGFSRIRPPDLRPQGRRLQLGLSLPPKNGLPLPQIIYLKLQ